MKPIDITDRETFLHYKNPSIINSEYQFSTLFIWQHAYCFEYELYENNLLVFGKQTNGDMQVYYPIGNEDNLKASVDYVKSVFKKESQRINFRPLSEQMKDTLLSTIDQKVDIGSKESYYDYIYDYRQLRDYAGSNYKRKRHELNRFCSRYQYCYESISTENAKEVYMALVRIMNQDDIYSKDELIAYKKLFDYYDALNLRGGVIRINGIIEAVAVCEEINDEMIMTLLKRCNKEYVGIYAAMFHFVLNNEFKSEKYKYVNSQDDMGVKGLREAKLSYHPLYRLKKYYIKEV